MTHVEEVVQRFVDAINCADLHRLAALMTSSHTFVDSDGSTIVGQAAVLNAWSQYFLMIRDYRVVVQERFSSDRTVVLVGTATGICASTEKRWTVPAAWRAIAQANQVATWQVFTNPEPIREAMGIGKET
jgi:ketosteroid isomerase-like protein